MQPCLCRFFAAIIIVCFFPVTSFAADDPGTSGRDWLEGFTLVELESDDVASLHHARELIQSHGGRVAIISPPSILMGWIPFELRAGLLGKANIKDIFYTDVQPGEVKIKDEQTRHMVTYYNRVIRGDYQKHVHGLKAAAPAFDPRSLRPDAMDAGELEEDAYLDNLRANGFDFDNLKNRFLIDKSTGAATANSDKMMGTVATTLIFMESDGSSTDPDTYTWTDQHVQDYIAGVNTGLAWWSTQAEYYGSCWVAFFVRYFPPTDSRCQQWREMVLHPQSEVANSVSIIMENFGYLSGGHTTRVDAFNTVQKATYHTNWAYTGFIAYNPPPAPAELTDGYAAWAYVGGPYAFLLYRSFGWAVDEVFTHETGHIFRACDEYYAEGYGGCTSCGVCANGVNNGNCEYCAASVPCMMKSSTFNLCSYTPGHLGWEIVPCAPPLPTGAGEETVTYKNRLHQNIPNPFNPSTTVRYEISERSERAPVKLYIYDVGGRLVRKLVDSSRPAGSYEAVWNGTNDAGQKVSSGIYFYKITAGEFTETRKMVLLK